METQKKGINVLTETLTSLAEVVGVVDEALEDNNINIVEGIRIALKATVLIKVVKTIKEAKAEFLDLDGAEKAQLTQHFEKVFDLRNDDAEKIVESIVKLAIEMGSSLLMFREISKTEKK